MITLLHLLVILRLSWLGSLELTGERLLVAGLCRGEGIADTTLLRSGLSGRELMVGLGMQRLLRSLLVLKI